MKPTKLPQPCPKCGRLIGGPSTDPGVRPPQDGDTAECLFCGAQILIRDGKLVRAVEVRISRGDA